MSASTSAESGTADPARRSPGPVPMRQLHERVVADDSRLLARVLPADGETRLAVATFNSSI
ncbi:hypothetical protein [Streptacidiphilus sp. PAMC 29251]